jgi:hypothetical protein
MIFYDLIMLCFHRWVKEIFSNCCRVVLNKGNDRLGSDGIVNILDAADKDEKYLTALKTFLDKEVIYIAV